MNEQQLRFDTHEEAQDYVKEHGSEMNGPFYFMVPNGSMSADLYGVIPDPRNEPELHFYGLTPETRDQHVREYQEYRRDQGFDLQPGQIVDLSTPPIDIDYERQTQALQQLGIEETRARLEGTASFARLENRLNEMEARFNLLSQDDILAYYEGGADLARNNFAVNRAIQMVNELPVEPAITQKELSAVHRQLVESQPEIDSANAWIAAAHIVIERYSQQQQKQQAIGM